MADGYRSIGAGIFPLQDIPLQWILRNAAGAILAYPPGVACGLRA